MITKKISVLTFHHAHNHGSMLQAYALQHFVKKIAASAGMEVEYKLIDFHTDFQEYLYSVVRWSVNPKDWWKNFIALLNYRPLHNRHQKFEKFLSDNFIMTRRYKSHEELEASKEMADVFITGSDQIWNVRAQDFSDVYFLPFVKSGKRISYAASFGPLKIDWQRYDSSKYATLLAAYDAISVREEGSADNVEYIIGERPKILLDPTFMLTSEEWRKVQSDADYKNGKYILLYCLEPSKSQLEMAATISKKFNLPIVVLRYNNKNDWFNPFVHKYDAGPTDFLAYIDHAALVLSSSFHGTAFSLIYHKPFYVFNGLADNRISTILHRTGLEERSIDDVSDINKVTLNPIDGNRIETFLNQERQRSADFLKESIGIE